MATIATGKTTSLGRVDLNALRTNQVLIISAVFVAFVLGTENGGTWVVAVAAVSMAIGAAMPGYGPFQLLYKRVVLKLGLVHPKPRADDPASHRFAQAVGTSFLTASAIFLFAGVPFLGWVLAGVVVSLALVNLLFGFCAGCFVFYQLRKAGIGA